MNKHFTQIVKPIAFSLCVLSLASCSLLPPSDTFPTATPAPSVPPSGYEPQPGDDALVRGNAFLDLQNSSLVVMESFPIQVSAILNGSLPDPCHQLRVVVSRLDAEKKVNLDVYSLMETGKICITMLQPFNATIKLGTFPTGHYSVYVNGELLGEFDA
jgi:hypothetical protein